VEGGRHPADDYKFFFANGNANYHLTVGFFVHKGIISALKGVLFICTRVLYITLSGL